MRRVRLAGFAQCVEKGALRPIIYSYFGEPLNGVSSVYHLCGAFQVADVSDRM